MREEGERYNISRVDFDGSKIPLDPPLFRRESPGIGSVFVFCFSADKIPRPTGYSLTVDDIVHARDTLECKIAARSNGRYAAAVAPE